MERTPKPGEHNGNGMEDMWCIGSGFVEEEDGKGLKRKRESEEERRKKLKL